MGRLSVAPENRDPIKKEIECDNLKEEGDTNKKGNVLHLIFIYLKIIFVRITVQLHNENIKVLRILILL